MTITLPETDVQLVDTTIAVSLSGSAKEPADYVAVAEDVTIRTGATSGSAILVVTPVDDGLPEDDEAIMVKGTLDNGSVSVASAVPLTLTDPLVPARQQRSTNSPPTFDETGPLTRSVDENSASSTAVGSPVSATDPDGDTLTYSLTGADATSFSIDGNGQIRVGQNATLDYETKATSTVTVNVSDGRNTAGNPDTSIDASVSVTISINNVDERPRPVTGLTATVLSPTSVRLDWTPSDTTDLPPLKQLSIAAEYRDSDRTEELKTVYLDRTDAVTYTYTGLTASTTYTFYVQVKNTHDLFKVSSITATTPANTPPSTADFTKNAVINTELAFSTSDFPFNDGNQGDSLNAVLIVTVPDSSHGSLKRYRDGRVVETLPSGRLLRHWLNEVNNTVFVPAKDFTGAATFTFKVLDQSGARSSGATATINVQSSANASPTFDETGQLTRSVDENSTSSTAVGSPVSATDSDGDPLTYTLTDASGNFTIASTTGKIQVGADASLDYETATSTTVTVNVSDGKDTAGNPDTSIDASVSVTISINNVDERPRPVTGLTATVLSPTSVRLDWTPSDTTDLPPINHLYVEASYRDSGGDHFVPKVILGTDAVTYTYTGLMDDTAYIFYVYVRNTDERYGIASQGARTLANTPPSTADFTKNAVINTELAFSASDFTFNDGNRGDSLSAVIIDSVPDSSHGSLKRYSGGSIVESLSSGKRLDHGKDEVDNTVFVPAQNFTGAATFTFHVEDQSGATSSVATTTINVQGSANASPTFDEGAGPLTRTILENSATGTAVGAAVSATDSDGDALTFTLNDPSGLFTIDDTTGQIRLGADSTIDYETGATSTTVTVGVSDGRTDQGGIATTTDASIDVTIDVADVKPSVAVVTLTALSEPRKMRVDWTYPQTADHAPVTRQEVKYFKLGTSPCDGSFVAAIAKELPASARSVDLPFENIITPLEAGAEYCVQVWANTSEGMGVGFAELTPWPITVPTSEDFRVYLPEEGRDLKFSTTDFPFTDPTPHDSLKQVKIVTLPESSDGVLKWTASGGSQASVPEGQAIDSDDLDTLVFALGSNFSTTSDPSFGPASFTFKVIDQTNTESSETSTSTIWNIFDARISSMEITSDPAVGDTYTQGETIQVTVTFDKYVDWDVSANGADITMQFGEDTDESWLFASLATGGNATGTERFLVFEHTVVAGNSNPDGLIIYSNNNIPVRLQGGATLRAEHGGLARPSATDGQIPTRDPNHKVNGDLVATTNSPPAFTQTGPLTFSLAESATSGASVGSPVTAHDSDAGDTLTYSLSGTSSASFDISASGQITVGADTFLDFEGATSTHELSVNVRDGKDNYGRADTEQDDSIDVTISITDVTEPSEPPVEITATVLSSTEIRVDWSAPVNRGRTPATAYELRFMGVRGGGSGEFTLDANTFTKTLTDLTPGTAYHTEMRAKNADGFSAWEAISPRPLTNRNSRPTSADFSKNAVPDTDLRFFASDFPFADADAGDSLKAIRIALVPQLKHGELIPFTDGLEQLAMIRNQLFEFNDQNTLKFRPAATGTASFTFWVIDQSDEISAEAYKATIYVQEDAPRFKETIPLARSIAENSAAGASVGAAIAAIDPNNDAITWSLTGEDAANFVIDESGQVTVGQGVTLDHESDKSSYTVFVEIHDGRGRDGSATSSDRTVTDAFAELTITVADADEPPPAPTGLALASDAPGTVTARWTAPDTAGRPPVNGYGVEYRLTTESAWTSHLRGCLRSDFTLGGPVGVASA